MPTMSTTVAQKVNGQDCLILKLPVEVFSSIIGLAIEAESCKSSNDQFARLRTAVRLSNTCHRVRNTLLPEIYSDIDIYPLGKAVSHETDKLRKSASRLREILKNNPELGRYCKNLHIMLDNPGSPSLPLKHRDFSESMPDAIREFRNTRHLAIYGCHHPANDFFNDRSRATISTALASLPELTTLSVKGTRIFLPAVLDGMRDVGKCHNLSVLEFHGEVSCSGSGERWHELMEFEGTAPFKKLELDKFGLPPKVLEALVRWPKELHALSCHPTISQIDSREWTWDILQPIFNIHMASLRELHIYDLYLEDHIELADLTGFTMLERLSLPAKLIGLDKRYIPCIIAPNLQFFKWQVEYEDGDQRIIDEEHEEWVRAVVEFAAKQQQKLKTIFIDVGYSSWELLGSVSAYPWDLLNDIDRDSERFGIRIRYDEPDISREEFEAVVHGDPDDNFD